MTAPARIRILQRADAAIFQAHRVEPGEAGSAELSFVSVPKLTSDDHGRVECVSL